MKNLAAFSKTMVIMIILVNNLLTKLQKSNVATLSFKKHCPMKQTINRKPDMEVCWIIQKVGVL